MILSLFFLFLMLLLISVAIFYLFCFFLPALKLKYEGISDSLATELQFSESDDVLEQADFSKVAVLEETDESNLEKRLVYKGQKNCRLFHETYGFEYKNPKVCIGFGDCVKICPQEAIFIRNNHAVISESCNGCGKCVGSCPEHLLSLVPRGKKISESEEKGFKFWSLCYRLFLVVRG